MLGFGPLGALSLGENPYDDIIIAKTAHDVVAPVLVTPIVLSVYVEITDLADLGIVDDLGITVPIAVSDFIATDGSDAFDIVGLINRIDAALPTGADEFGSLLAAIMRTDAIPLQGVDTSWHDQSLIERDDAILIGVDDLAFMRVLNLPTSALASFGVGGVRMKIGTFKRH